MSDPIDRRCFLGIAAATAMSTRLSGQPVEAVATASADRAATDAGGASRQARSFLTEAGAFVDVGAVATPSLTCSRGRHCRKPD